MIKYQVRSEHQKIQEIDASAPKIAATRFVKTCGSVITGEIEVVAKKNIHKYKKEEL